MQQRHQSQQMKKRGLGRGLDALLGNSTANLSNIGMENEGLRTLPVDVIQQGRYQPRHHMDPTALQELADSIRAQGIVQPIVVRQLTEPGRYEIIAGERRWRAAQMAGLHEISVVVRDVSDVAAMAMSLIENIQREDLNPIDEAVALQRLIDETGLTHQEAAEAVGRSRAAVSNLLRLLLLNTEVKEMLGANQLEAGHAKVLLALEGGAQTQAARQITAKGMSVRDTERLVRNFQKDKKSKPAKKQDDVNLYYLEEQVAEKLGARVKFQHTHQGKGKLIIHYNSLDELEGILEHLK